MGFKDSVNKHHCNFPFEVTREELKPFWECDECSALYKVSRSNDWTGFWSPDTSGEVVEGVTKYGTPAIYAMDEKFNVCHPHIEFKNILKGNLWGEYYTSHIQLQEEMPEKWKAMDGKIRPLWRDKPLPQGAAVKAEDGYSLSRVVSPGDDDLGLAPELKKKPKKRWWLQ